MKGMYSAASEGVRQIRMDSQQRPAGQNAAQQEHEALRSKACAAVANYTIYNENISLKELLEEVPRYVG